MEGGKSGVVFLSEIVDVPRFREATLLTVAKFELKTRKTEPFTSGVSYFAVSANGEKALFRHGPPASGTWTIAGTGAAPKAGEGALKLGDMEDYSDPRAEWGQMYREAWRVPRDVFYDPSLHGLNLAGTEKKYRAYLAGGGGRADLNYLFTEMLGDITVGHMVIGGGDGPKPNHVKGGLLGADYKVENGRYRFARIFNGENWYPTLRAPLTQPGVDAKTGEYLISVNGREVYPPESVYSFFENTAGEQGKKKNWPNPNGQGARRATLAPVGEEFPLRHPPGQADNRANVQRVKGGSWRNRQRQ